MTPNGWLTHPWAVLWTEALLHFVWQGAVLAALAGLALKLQSPRVRYALLVGVFAAMTVCPAATMIGLSLFEAAPALTDQWGVSPQSPRFEIVESEPMTFIHDAAVEQPSAPAIASLISWQDALIGSQPFVLSCWMCGALVFCLRIVLGACGIWNLVRSAQSVPESWLVIARRLQSRFDRHSRTAILASKNVCEPLAVWWFRPVILLPAAWLAEVPPGVLEAVLAHELAHLRRFDLWINFYQRIGEMVLFYHPGVWWVSRRIRLERELCCDAAAVALTGEALRYAQALEYVATKRLELFRPVLAAGMGGTEMTLLNRVQRVLGVESPRRVSGGWPLGLAMAAIVGAGGLFIAMTSRDVIGDDSPGVLVAQNDQDNPPPRREAPPPDGPRKERSPRGDAGPPPERGPRDGNPPGGRGGPPPGEIGGRGGPPPGPGGDAMRELMHEIRALRDEVARLREEVRAMRGGERGPAVGVRGGDGPRGERAPGGPGPRGGDRAGGGPPPRDGDFGPGGRGPRDGDGPPRGGAEGRGPGAGPGPRDGARPPREGDRGGTEGRRDPAPGGRDNPPAGEGRPAERPARPPANDPVR